MIFKANRKGLRKVRDYILFGGIRKVFMEQFAFELGLGKEMVMRGKRRPIRGNAMKKGRGRKTMKFGD